MCQSTNSIRQEVTINSTDTVGNFADHIVEIFNSIAGYSDINQLKICEAESANLALTNIQTLIAQINKKKKILEQIQIRIN